MSEERSELFEQALEGSNRRLQELAADGLLPILPEQLMALQVRIAVGGDPELADRARSSLADLDRDWLRRVLREESDPEVLTYYSLPDHNRMIREVALQNRKLPVLAIERVAPTADQEIQEIILLRQDLLLSNPELLDLLAGNPDLSAYSRRRIEEYRKHLFGETDEAEPEVEGEEGEIDARRMIAALLAEDEELSPDDAEDLLDEVDRVLAESEVEGEIDERTKLSEGQIRAFPVAVRMKLARGASRTVRGILLKDPNPQVAVAVVQGAAVTEAEAEQIASNRHVCDEVLTEISRRREWVRKYTIVHNLVKNPKTPPGIAVKLLPRLSVRDLGRLRSDRNVADAVRQVAIRMHMTKSR
ncbi:MAG: hypothetical protein DWQ36_09475 [Acidobacteria bacterium]|mgnify:FL=1|nr:MAG: hypothetical protein DWQ30_04900 [Acidobacteriota bacterium]REK08585.1 MAG: hypothetical protein DWQ36_09475 [Acidobacteriota bacterium]